MRFKVYDDCYIVTYQQWMEQITEQGYIPVDCNAEEQINRYSHWIRSLGHMYLYGLITRKRFDSLVNKICFKMFYPELITKDESEAKKLNEKYRSGTMLYDCLTDFEASVD